MGPITEEALTQKLSNEVEGKILNYERISSKYKKKPYEIKSELDEKYLEKAKEVINEVGEFIAGFLPKFFSYQRSNFHYVRKHKVEFLSEYQLLVETRAKTDKEEKELSLSFDLPSSIYLPRILYRMKGQYVYLYDHLGSRISFVIGSSENPKTEDYFVDDAMEELWHLAIYPLLIEELNRNLKTSQFTRPESDLSEMLVKEGEFLSKAFAFTSLEEFAKKTGHDVSNKEVRGKEKTLVEKLRRMRIKKALKQVSRPGAYEI